MFTRPLRRLTQDLVGGTCTRLRAQLGLSRFQLSHPRRKLVALVSAGLLLTLVASLAQAAEKPLILSDAGTSAKWSSFYIRSDGSVFDVLWRYTTDDRPMGVGMWIYNLDGTFRGGGSWSQFLYQDSFYYDVDIQGQEIQGGEVSAAYGYSTQFGMGMLLPGTPAEPKTYIAIAWSIGDLEKGWEFTLRGPDGVQLLRDQETGELIAASGTDSFMHTSGDFEAAANVGVQRSVPRIPGLLPNGFGPGAHVIAQGTLPIEIDDAWLGFVQELRGTWEGHQANSLTVTSANGFTKDCRWPTADARLGGTGGCYFYEAVGPLSVDRGHYQVNLSGAGAGIGPFGDVFVWGIDAHFPPAI